MKFNKVNTVWLLFIAVAVFMLLLPLLQQGMFLDGQQYGAVAMNYANGKGTFWHPFLTKTWGYFHETAFLEHPPLGYALESLSFKLFGNSYLSERLYNLFLFLISCGLLVYLWILMRGKQAKNEAGFILVYFISIGTVGWAFSNNIWEVQMAIFDLMAVIFILKAYKSENVKSVLLFSAIAGIAITAAVLVKGVPGFFPLAVPAGLIFLKPKKSISIIQFIVLLATLATLLGLYFSSVEAQESINYYINKRLLHRIDAQPTVNSHFHILIDLVSQLIPVFILSLMPLVIQKRTKLQKEEKQQALFFLYIGLTATLPLMLTLIQRGFYLYPSYFYYSMAFAIISAKPWKNILLGWPSKIHRGIQKGLSMLIVIGIGLTFFFAGKPTRDTTTLNDVEILKTTLPSNTVLFYNTYEHGEKLDMGLYMYLVRFSELVPSTKLREKNEKYCIQNKGEIAREGYEIIPTELVTIDLYKKSEM